MPPQLVNRQCCIRLRRCIYQKKSPAFSTSSASNAQIPPESPRFIQVPRLVQPKQPFVAPVKGVLPAPRKIFPRKSNGQTHKVSPEYLAAVVPEPLIDKTARTDDGFVSWKARQSELRRRNLREGLVELGQRKQEMDRKNAYKKATSNKLREQLLYARERKDVWLTSPTVLSSQQPVRNRRIPDPTRPARLAVMSQNVADMAALREEARRNALHTLYVNAGDFITTGRQLERMVDKAFDGNSQFRSDSSEGVNIWNLGPPETVQELLQRANKLGKQTALQSAEGNELVMRERMRKISGELTGGKMLEEG